MTDTCLEPMPLTKKLREATHPTHEALDKSIMSADPFASREGYARWLKMQYALHRDVSPLYDLEAVAEHVPGLAGLCRLTAVEADAQDLGVALPELAEPPLAANVNDVPEALGWLYVVEGSNLGAAFLYKAVQKLGLDADLGAKHLAAAAEGRAAHWRAFTSAVDAIELTEEEVARASEAAAKAFARASELGRAYL